MNTDSHEVDFITNIDTNFFLLLNGWHAEWLDPVMVWISGKTTWWPFYTLLLLFLGWTRKWQLAPILLMIILSITLTDQVSVHLFKETIMRLRPCHNPDIQHLVHLASGKCGGQFGFVSSHAANSFGVAMLLSLVVQKRWFWFTLMGWAALVSYSRIYLGVHYPGDILGGALLGMLSGYLVFLLLKWLLPRLPESWQMRYPLLSA